VYLDALTLRSSWLPAHLVTAEVMVGAAQPAWMRTSSSRMRATFKDDEKIDASAVEELKETRNRMRSARAVGALHLVDWATRPSTTEPPSVEWGPLSRRTGAP